MTREIKFWPSDTKCIEPVDYLDYFVECSICSCLVKRYHTTMLVLSREIQCYYCLYPDKYKREEHPKECVAADFIIIPFSGGGAQGEPLL